VQIFIQMKVKEVVDALERFAPLPLQDGFDNAGLQVGLTEATVTGALLCLDVTEAVIDEAIERHCNVIISHHPLLFNKLKRVTGTNYIERCVMKAIRHGIAVYSAHTNMDNAMYGVNFKMAEKLGLQQVEILEPKADNLVKLVTYVPTSHADEVRKALFAAGCGNIGNYDGCSYNVEGVGTFRAGDGTHPFVGEVGEEHHEEEIRIETIVPAYKEGSAVKALLEVHPYEEPVYDLFPLKNKWSQAGAGVIGELKNEMPVPDFLQLLKHTFGVACVRYNDYEKNTVKSVALCGGAGAFLMPLAISRHADVFVTGEIKYHEFFGHEDEILLAEIGHYESEQYTKEIFYSIIKDLCPELPVYQCSVVTNPIKYL
jgi:dinuclear metal center YbgI/SA1388 family protein